jgi:pyrimidine-nucleoside phosphorylase
MTPLELIVRKRDGMKHSAEEIRVLVSAVMDGSMADYQLSAWLMAAFLRGLSPAETLDLTIAMRNSGERVDWGDLPGVKLDKHSSGGVGDKTTLVVVPLLAAAGVPILKMSGRGLGHAGGPVDKLESIPGFRTDLPADEAREQVRAIGAALVGQSPSLAPADKKLYALRDVTGTVESLPLIAASIMSKKLAGGADAVLLDVKVGGGAYMKDLAQADALARQMVEIGRGAGVRTVAMLTDMEEPLGRTVGNALEVREAIELLTGAGHTDERFRELCLALVTRGLLLAGKASGEEEAQKLAETLLQSGAGARKLEEIIEAQGGDPAVVAESDRLPQAASINQVAATENGYVSSIDAEAIGRLAMEMGAGRVRKEDEIDPPVGIVLRAKVGSEVRRGDTLAELHIGRVPFADAWETRLRSALQFSQEKPSPRPVIIGIEE